MTGSKQHTFPKAEKLKSRKQIDLLFKEGKSFFAAPVKCYYRVTSLQVDRLTSLHVDKLDGLEVDRPTSLPVADVESGSFSDNQTTNNKPQTINLKPQTSNPKPGTSNLRAGVSVSKRNFKKATDRNRIKRLLREAYRIHKAPLLEKTEDRQVQLEVFFVFTDKTMPAFSLIEEKMKYCMRRLIKIVEGGV